MRERVAHRGILAKKTLYGIPNSTVDDGVSTTTLFLRILLRTSSELYYTKSLTRTTVMRAPLSLSPPSSPLHHSHAMFKNTDDYLLLLDLTTTFTCFLSTSHPTDETPVND